MNTGIFRQGHRKGKGGKDAGTEGPHLWNAPVGRHDEVEIHALPRLACSSASVDFEANFYSGNAALQGHVLKLNDALWESTKRFLVSDNALATAQIRCKITKTIM